MLAAEAHPEVVELLAERFERCVTWTNKRGVDAVRVGTPHLRLPFLQCTYVRLNNHEANHPDLSSHPYL